MISLMAVVAAVALLAVVAAIAVLALRLHKDKKKRGEKPPPVLTKPRPGLPAPPRFSSGPGPVPATAPVAAVPPAAVVSLMGMTGSGSVAPTVAGTGGIGAPI